MGQESSNHKARLAEKYTIEEGELFNIWRNKETKEQVMEEYEIVLDGTLSAQLYQQMQIRRSHESGQLVKVHHFQHTDSGVCLTAKGTLLTERIPFRLAQCSRVPWPKVLYVLRQVMESCKKLQLFYGNFRVKPMMIGLNRGQQVKVWHSSDYSALAPEIPGGSIHSMIESIIKSVEKSAQQPSKHPKFSKYYQNKVNNMMNPSVDSTVELLNHFHKQYQIPFYDSPPNLEKYLDNIGRKGCVSEHASKVKHEEQVQQELRATDSGEPKVSQPLQAQLPDSTPNLLRQTSRQMLVNTKPAENQSILLSSKSATGLGTRPHVSRTLSPRIVFEHRPRKITARDDPGVSDLIDIRHTSPAALNPQKPQPIERQIRRTQILAVKVHEPSETNFIRQDQIREAQRPRKKLGRKHSHNKDGKITFENINPRVIFARPDMAALKIP